MRPYSAPLKSVTEHDAMLVRERSKKNVALLLSFKGTAYRGMQKNAPIEGAPIINTGSYGLSLRAGGEGR